MSDIQYINGLIVKAPNERAPEYVKAKLSIKREELIGWLQGQSGEWINADVKVSQGGKWYAAVDTWKPESKQDGQRQERAPSRGAAPAGDASFADVDGDDIPFAPINRKSYL